MIRVLKFGKQSLNKIVLSKCDTFGFYILVLYSSVTVQLLFKDVLVFENDSDTKGKKSPTVRWFYILLTCFIPPHYFPVSLQEVVSVLNQSLDYGNC